MNIVSKLFKKYRRFRRNKKKKTIWNTFLNRSQNFPKSIDGTIQISINSRSIDNESALLHKNDAHIHRHTFVNGPTYKGMEDNDLRGYLDGHFANAWNQPGQIHVRIGRVPCTNKFGECELFRVLQRWDNLRLPEGVEITNCRLELEVEKGVKRELEIHLYEVHKDWNPGQGGVKGNNNSVPLQGEVWWNEVGHNIKDWGLPGAGFASDSHPDSDTPVSPLAIAQYKPGNSHINFQSTELNSYVEKKIAREEPVLFLLKLSDYLEDLQGSCINIYSANHGDNKNTSRRPKLTIDWKDKNASSQLKSDIMLEYGRSKILPRFEIKDMVDVSVSFLPENNDEKPTIYFRGGNNSTEINWQKIDFPKKLDNWSWLEIRIDAHTNPVRFGKKFKAKFRDTWVKTAPPDQQKIPWTFISPSNKKYTVFAEYIGDYSWQTSFQPDEPGRWHYMWKQNFIEETYKSAKGKFDVIPGEREFLIEAIKQLIDKINSSKLSKGEERMYEFGPEFHRLQRELVRFETPESFNDSKNKEWKKLINEVRELLGGDIPSRYIE